MTLKPDESISDSVTFPILVDVLTAQRGRFSYPSPEQKAIYDVLYERLISSAAGLLKFDPPGLLVIGSASGLSEMVSFGSDRWIVYDTYLGHVLSRMEQLVAPSTTLPSIDAHLMRLYVSRLFVGGRIRDAYTIALVQVIQGNESDIDVSPDPSRYTHMYAEEAYVLAHELGHALFHENPAMASMLSNIYFEYCKAEASDISERSHPTIEEMAASMADDVNREYVRRYGHISEEELASGKRSLIAAFINDLASAELPDSQEIRTEKLLAEEVVCDAFAAILVARAFSDGTPASTLDALAESFNASQKLRLIKYMDARIGSEGIDSKVVRDTTIRGRQLRQIFRAIYESDMTELLFGFEASSSDINAMNARIRDMNMQFYSTLFDQLLSGSFFEIADGILKRDSEGLLSHSTSTLTGCWNVVNNYLGFGDEYDANGDPIPPSE